MSKNVVIDLGNMLIKYKGDNVGNFSSKVESGFNPLGEYKERVELENNQITYIGTGELSREYSKVKKNYLPQLLYAIRQSTEERDINLAVLLPIDQMPMKEEMVNQLKFKTFRPIINGKTTTITITNLVILPEGMSAIYSTDDYLQDDCLYIDIGSRTVNYSSMVEGKLEKTWTEKLGIYDLYQEIARVENSKGEDYTTEEIERQIQRGRIKVDDALYRNFLLKVLNKTKGQVNTKNYTTKFVGGGSLALKKYIELYSNTKVDDDVLYSNVNGAYKMIQAKWGDK